MKLLVQSAMFFFGTLLMAALVALGDPAAAGMPVVPHGGAVKAAVQLLASAHLWKDGAPAQGAGR
jgi:hypothetical protein